MEHANYSRVNREGDVLEEGAGSARGSAAAGRCKEEGNQQMRPQRKLSWELLGLHICRHACANVADLLQVKAAAPVELLVRGDDVDALPHPLQVLLARLVCTARVHARHVECLQDRLLDRWRGSRRARGPRAHGGRRAELLVHSSNAIRSHTATSNNKLTGCGAVHDDSVGDVVVGKVVGEGLQVHRLALQSNKVLVRRCTKVPHSCWPGGLKTASRSTGWPCAKRKGCVLRAALLLQQEQAELNRVNQR